MNFFEIREKILSEIELVPEAKLSELYDFIHYFRLGIEKSENATQQIMRFAGCWENMSDEVYNQLTKELILRRKQAFSRRKSNETSID